MPFEIVRNDITKMQVDAIVNTANPEPVVGSGTDYAIHKAAGPELLEARRVVGCIAPGHSVSTSAFGLSAKYVLHTVTPAWKDGRHREAELLREAYDAALNLAEQLHCESVAFPLMATGNYAYPRDIAMRAAINAFTDFLMCHEMLIYLVVFSDKSYQLAGSLFGGLKSFIDDNYVAEHAAEEYAWGYRDPNRRPASLSGSAANRIDARKDERQSGAQPIDLKSYISTAECGLSQYVQELLRETGMSGPDVYGPADISRQLFSRIINDRNYVPRKNTLVKLALGFHLDMEQTQKLLGKVGYALTNSSKSDLAMQYFIERGEYNLIEIDFALDEVGLPTLNGSE